MSNKQLPTVSIAIPAHNEAANMPSLLLSIARQKLTGVRLETVMVACDGCSDETARIARSYARNFPTLVVLDDGKRKGKAGRLNQMLELLNSDYIVTLDADLVLAKPTVLQALLKPFAKKSVMLVAARLQPVSQTSLMGRFSFVSFRFFMDAAYAWNGGNNFFTMIGGAQAMRRSFAKGLRYPTGLVSDQSFTYAAATSIAPNAYTVAHNATVLTRTVSTFHDWRLLGTRSIGKNKSDAVEYFGTQALATATIPKSLVFASLLRWLRRDPIGTIGAIIMNIFIRLFPLQTEMKNGIWENTISSKQAIK